MKKQLLFVGDIFKHNTSLQHYVIRRVEDSIGKCTSINYFNESDRSLFLHMDQEFKENSITVIATSANSFTVVGKLLSTITEDNLTLSEDMLIPSRSIQYEKDSYLLTCGGAKVNVIVAMENELLPNILLEYSDETQTLHIFEENMDVLQQHLKPLAQTHNIKITFSQIVDGWTEITASNNRFGNMELFFAAVKEQYENSVIASPNIAKYIIERLSAHQKKITFAESCTGGLLSSFFTAQSGASVVFEGSLITYCNTLKANWLAVDEGTLEKFGAVSTEVVDEMSEGALNVSSADYSVSVSGIAGPDGGSDEKPVGTVCISARSKTEVKTELLHFKGDRNYIQQQSLFYAVKMLLLIDKEVFFQ